MPETTLAVRVKPGSKRTAIEIDERGVTVRVQARPVEGAANDAVRQVLADAIGVAPSAVTLVRGAKSRDKTFSVAGKSAADLDAWRAAQRPKPFP